MGFKMYTSGRVVFKNARPFSFMNIEIRKLEEADVPRIVVFLREFAAFEKLSEYCTVTEERLKTAIFGDEAFVEGLIACDDGKLVGYAIFFPHFSSFRGERGLYLEDIYVADTARGKGVGEAMLREIAVIAESRGYERIDFQVLKWNENAIKFYRKLGAVSNDDETHFKFSGDAFEKLFRP